MTWPWRSPDATRHALRDRIKARHPSSQVPQRLREVAYRRLLARLFVSQPDRWVVKGGAALLLRLDPNRTSNDIDLAYVAEAGEHAIALEALVEAAATDLEDFFSFEIGRGQAVEIDSEHPLERAISVPVVARIGETTFAQFSVDLGLPRDDVLAIDWLQPTATLTGDTDVDVTPQVAVLSLPAQVADKACAIYEVHGVSGAASSRARDLADLAMIASQERLDGTAVAQHVQRQQNRRLAAGTLREQLPARLALSDAQRDDWSARWKTATRDAPIAFEEAERVAALMLDPVFRGTTDGQTWDPTELRWS